jgi:dTDP-4-dehydrorhamnose reductase
MSSSKIEIWGGVECTINRVGENYHSQLLKGGYYQRENNIELIAELGVKKLRYPVLWEYVEQSRGKYDYKNIPHEINKLSSSGITPIAGLIHHGSGPKFTNLNDENFAEHFAKYASKTAQLFPQIEFYTPVNEPLTTARFSGLYGVWYPHKKDNLSFCKMFLNECKATVLAFKEIKKINPHAKLVQTEDIGKVKSSPSLQYQADFENCRRWLTYDILCGKVVKGHAMYDFFLYCGITEKELEFFIENPCPPDILGINYYVISERYLDENISKYHSSKIGGNGKHLYADIETVRTNETLDGLHTIVNEAWERYKIPIAITELHLACSREEQLKWLNEGWNVINKLKRRGVEIKALTFWNLFGAFNWHNLLTKDENKYETGAYELNGNSLRLTAIGKFAKSLTGKKSFESPVINSPGWWRRPERILYKVIDNESVERKIKPGKKILITGATGTLGQAFAKVCRMRNLDFILTGRNEMNICDKESIKRTIEKIRPWAVINTAGFVNIEAAEKDKLNCFLTNTIGAGNLAEICARKNVKYVTFSSDLVFDGTKKKPYLETDGVAPINIYGASKASAERRVKNVNPDALIIRTSSFFGPWDKFNFVSKLMDAHKVDAKVKVPKDVLISPSYIPDLVYRTLDLLIDDESGIFHLTNTDNISWAEFAFLAAEILNINTSFIEPVEKDRMKYIARRPQCSALNSERSVMLGNISDALYKLKAEINN